jgi:hypothetical protein
MNDPERTRNVVALLREAIRNPETETELGRAVARLREPFLVGVGDRWHYEGFVGAFAALSDALGALDDSIPPGLPPHLLDPAWIAKAFHIPLEDFNWTGRPAVAAVSASPGQDARTGETTAYVTLTEAAKLIPGRASGRRVSVTTLWRWCIRGVHGVRLRSVLVGGHRCTTRTWLQEFIEAITSAAEPPERTSPQVRTPRQRQSAADRAAEELKAAWQQHKCPPAGGGAPPPG